MWRQFAAHGSSRGPEALHSPLARLRNGAAGSTARGGALENALKDPYPRGSRLPDAAGRKMLLFFLGPII